MSFAFAIRRTLSCKSDASQGTIIISETMTRKFNTQELFEYKLQLSDEKTLADEINKARRAIENN